MHKKLAADLTSLAHSILQMKNKEDVFALKAKAHDVYEKLALLAYVEEYINTTPNTTTNKETLIASIVEAEKNLTEASDNNIINDTVEETVTEVVENSIANENIIATDIEETAIPTVDATIEVPTINENIVESTIEEIEISPTNTETPTIDEAISLIESIEASISNEDILENTIEENEISTTNTDEVTTENEADFEEDMVIGNKFTQDIPFTINKPHQEPIVQESLFSEEPEEKADSNEIIEQPFDELESILFGDPSSKDEASFIENLKNPDTTEDIAPVSNEIPASEDEFLIIEELKSEEIVDEIVAPNESLAEETTIPTENETKKPTLEEELEGTISVDVMANLFEKAPVKKTLNDRLFTNTIKIDLNDRIAFVKNLFDGNQEDFNRVISQLNTIKTEKEAKTFILKMVKPDYDWSHKEAYEIRLLEIIERRFA